MVNIFLFHHMKNFKFSAILILIYIAIINIPTSWADVYHTEIYPLIDAFLSAIFGWSSFSIGDILYGILVIFCLYKLIFYFSKKQWQNMLIFTLQTSFSLLIAFQLLWGINNFKTPLDQQLQLKKGYTYEQLIDFTLKKIENINSLYDQIPTKNDFIGVKIEEDYDLFYDETLKNLEKVDFINHKSIAQLKKAKPSMYSYFQTKMGFSGYFNPFTHENQINYKIPHTSKPTTYTHELIHQLGYSSEAETNFITYCALYQSDNMKIRYAAELFVVKYALNEIYRIDDEKFIELSIELREGVMDNFYESVMFWKKNKNFSSPIAKKIYGWFLKSNNQKEGIRSYNKVIDLLINYESISSDSLRFKG